MSAQEFKEQMNNCKTLLELMMLLNSRFGSVRCSVEEKVKICAAIAAREIELADNEERETAARVPGMTEVAP